MAQPGGGGYRFGTVQDHHVVGGSLTPQHSPRLTQCAQAPSARRSGNIDAAHSITRHRAVGAERTGLGHLMPRREKGRDLAFRDARISRIVHGTQDEDAHG
jgi:hypothetical protein